MRATVEIGAGSDSTRGGLRVDEEVGRALPGGGGGGLV